MDKTPFQSGIIDPKDLFLGGYFDRYRNLLLDVYYSEQSSCVFTINAEGLQDKVKSIDGMLFNLRGIAIYGHPEHWYQSSFWAINFAYERLVELKIMSRCI